MVSHSDEAGFAEDEYTMTAFRFQDGTHLVYRSSNKVMTDCRWTRRKKIRWKSSEHRWRECMVRCLR